MNEGIMGNNNYTAGSANCISGMAISSVLPYPYYNSAVGIRPDVTIQRAANGYFVCILGIYYVARDANQVSSLLLMHLEKEKK